MELSALVLSLPAHNSTMRMRVWRALKESGCGVLRDGVYVLPAGAEAVSALAAVESDIKAAGGFATTMEVKLKDDVRPLFDRGADYAALSRRIRAAQGSLPQLGARKAQTLVRRLERSFEELQKIDFFPGEAKVQAAQAITAVKQRERELYGAGEPHRSRKAIKRLERAKYQGKLWATRKEPWVDRLASAWLIKRFIDRAARFAWIASPRARPKRSIGFDFDGAQFTHAGSRVTFEVLLSSFGLEGDPALAFIGALVHYLDVGGIPIAEARGLETLLTGVKSRAKSDDELLQESLRIFDLLYAGHTQRTEAANPSSLVRA